MKKFVSILMLCTCLLMSFGFGSCNEHTSEYYFVKFIGGLLHGLILSGSQDSSSDVFSIGFGNDGVIIKSDYSDTLNFSFRNSGTTQNLNGMKIQPTTYQPLVIAVGNNGTITRSTNQGETWIVSTPVTSSNLNAIDIGSGTQHCAGDNGVLMISYNLGANWSLQSSGTSRNLKGIGMNGGYVVAVGENGTILRTTNSGQNWLNVSLPDTTINLYCVSQRTRQNFNATNFYIAGSQGKIYKSTDNGATWTLKNSGTSNTLHSIFFSGNDSGAVSGDNGTIKITTNAGETWFSDPYFNNITGRITSISQMPRSARTFTALSNNNKLYIASEDSNLVVIGVKNIGSEIPDQFSLSQNYPNPFNPVTNIMFIVKQNTSVKLVIYDLSGREIETIVNQKLASGTYSADWNASKYSSGVYFYKLSAGEFSQTKKMVLVK